MIPKSLSELIDDLIDQAIMDNAEFADEILREAGYSPVEVGEKMAAFAKRCSEKAAAVDGKIEETKGNEDDSKRLSL